MKIPTACLTSSMEYGTYNETPLLQPIIETVMERRGISAAVSPERSCTNDSTEKGNACLHALRHKNDAVDYLYINLRLCAANYPNGRYVAAQVRHVKQL